jgi:hypothetical protein
LELEEQPSQARSLSAGAQLIASLSPCRGLHRTDTLVEAS